MADYDVLVAGDGLAGLTAAFFSARHGHSTAVLGAVPGGAVLSITKIDDFPGFAEAVAGYELCPSLQEQAMTAGAEFRMTQIEALEQGDDGWVATTSEGPISARTVIVATGRKPRRLGVPGEDRLFGHGISDCASCDGPMLRDTVVGVVGGGDSALLEALELTEFVSEVLVFHRGDSFRAQQVYQDRVEASPKITVRFGTEVVEVLGEDKVNGVRVRDASGGESEVELAGLFVYVGGEPQTAFLDGVVELDELGRVPTDTWMRTSAAGLYAVGSIRRDSAEQAVTAAGDGATAAVAAHRYLIGADVPAAQVESTA